MAPDLQPRLITIRLSAGGAVLDHPFVPSGGQHDDLEGEAMNHGIKSTIKRSAGMKAAAAALALGAGLAACGGGGGSSAKPGWDTASGKSLLQTAESGCRSGGGTSDQCRCLTGYVTSHYTPASFRHAHDVPGERDKFSKDVEDACR
jgi:hypothetical protein